MKVLQVNCVYEYGSTGKITATLHHALLRAGEESVVYYGRRERTDEPGVHKICAEWYGKAMNGLSRLTGLPYGQCGISTARLIAAIRREAPDIVHLQCVNGYFVNLYELVRWLKRSGIPTVLTLHAEFMYTANCGHAFECEQWRTGCHHCPRPRQATKSLVLNRTASSFAKMERAFSGFGDRLTVVSVSPWLEKRAQMSPILGAFRQERVLNGVDPRIFHLREERDRIRAGLGLEDKKILLHVTACFSADPGHPKGGAYVLALARALAEEPVCVLIVGRGTPPETVPDNVRFLGEITDRDRLAQLYAAADVTVLTSRRETFSMPCAESLCCGTPVVGFEAGGPEEIALPEYSSFSPFGDGKALKENVLRWIRNSVDRQTVAALAERTYSDRRMCEEYMRIYKDML